MEDYQALKIENVFKIVNSSSAGLTTEEAKKRLLVNGPNILATVIPYNRLKVFISQFKNPLIYILLSTGIISLALGDKIDAQVIGAAVFINILIGFIQEDRANNALSKLKKIVEHQTFVKRNGQELEIPTAEVVVGDILVLKAGAVIPADARVFKNSDLEVNEASLTGESLAVSKSILPCAAKSILANRKSLVYAGTNIVSGHGLAVIIATGTQTEIGKIAEMVKTAKNSFNQKIISGGNIRFDYDYLFRQNRDIN